MINICEVSKYYIIQTENILSIFLFLMSWKYISLIMLSAAYGF